MDDEFWRDCLMLLLALVFLLAVLLTAEVVPSFFG